MLKEDSILLSTIEDKRAQCDSQNVLTYTGFLDIRQCAMVESEFKFTKHILYGGYEDAERRIMLFLPDYIDELCEEYNPLAILRVSIPKGGRQLSHRDYLGSILSLGIERDVTGDIVVRPNGADIVILKSIGEYLLSNYDKAGHTNLSVEILPISDIDLGEIHTVMKKDTVASLRLDNLIGSAFNLSRTKAQDAIKGGVVFVNNIQEIKPDKALKVGDKFVLRGRGKAILSEIGGTTKKGRLAIVMEVFM